MKVIFSSGSFGGLRGAAIQLSDLQSGVSGNLLKCEYLNLSTRSAESETLWGGSQQSVLTNSSRDSDATPKIENHCCSWKGCAVVEEAEAGASMQSSTMVLFSFCTIEQYNFQFSVALKGEGRG